MDCAKSKGSGLSLLKNRFPASIISGFLLCFMIDFMKVDLRGRPPVGLFFQPQGSVSPFTFEVNISLMLSEGEKLAKISDNDNIKNKKNCFIINCLYLKKFLFYP